MRHYRILAKGKVQGVGFRNFTKKYATANNLKGSVENLISGDVEIFISLPKDDATRSLDSFLEALQKGNGKMKVSYFEIKILEKLDFIDFEIL